MQIACVHGIADRVGKVLEQLTHSNLAVTLFIIISFSTSCSLFVRNQLALFISYFQSFSEK